MDNFTAFFVFMIAGQCALLCWFDRIAEVKRQRRARAAWLRVMGF